MIRVLLVDDHPMVRVGLRVLLGETSDVKVVGEVADGDAAVEFVERERPEVVLMDLSMPGADGAVATRAISAAHPDVKVVILTTFVDRERVIEAVDSGAVGYLLKDADPDVLVRDIRAAARGESPFAPRAAQALLAERAERNGRSVSAAVLTDREWEILRLVARGMANKEIARQLSISEKTVKAHLGSAFQRIRVRDRTQAALWVERNELAH